MKSDLKRVKLFRKDLLKKTGFLKENLDLDVEEEVEGKSESGNERKINFEPVSNNPSTIVKRTYNAPSTGVAVSFLPNDEIGKGRSKFHLLKGGKGLKAVCDINPEYDLLQYRNHFIKKSWKHFL